VGDSSSSKRKASSTGAGNTKGSKRSRGAPTAPTTYENIVDAEHGTQWLVVLRKNGFFEVSRFSAHSNVPEFDGGYDRFGLCLPSHWLFQQTSCKACLMFSSIPDYRILNL
jgi:hypothetical protein